MKCEFNLHIHDEVLIETSSKNGVFRNSLYYKSNYSEISWNNQQNSLQSRLVFFRREMVFGGYFPRYRKDINRRSPRFSIINSSQSCGKLVKNALSAGSDDTISGVLVHGTGRIEKYWERRLHTNMKHNSEHLNSILQFMEAMNKIAFFCGFVLLVLLVCPMVSAYDDRAVQYFRDGVDFAKLRQYPEALASYDKAIAINPNYYEAWVCRGGVLGLLGRYSEAVDSCDKAIAINPNIADAWNNRGVNMGSLGRHSESLASYDKALSIDPNDANVWYNRGNALSNLGRFIEAVASYDKAIDINPNDAEVKQNREIALNKQTHPTPLMYAPIGAIVLMVGIAVWSRRRSPQ
jgi:tetratricopeptide (TPR) repeat protein